MWICKLFLPKDYYQCEGGDLAFSGSPRPGLEWPMAKRRKPRGAYDRVTENLIKQLEVGVAPWVRPWSGGGGLGLPENGSTGKRYRGANVLVLWGAAMASGYDSNKWLTFKQAKSMGGSIRRGERGTSVLFWGSAKKTVTGDDGKEVERELMFVRTYTVFAVEQTEGIETPMLARWKTRHREGEHR